MVTNLSDLGPLAGLSHLSTLDLNNCWNLSDLGPLAGLSRLTTLYLHHSRQVSDLSPLAGLSRPQQAGPELLQQCERSESVGQVISSEYAGPDPLCSLVSDLDPLAGLTDLAGLRLAYCVLVGDLSPLAGLSHLTTLDSTGCGRKIRAGRLRALARAPAQHSPVDQRGPGDDEQ